MITPRGEMMTYNLQNYDYRGEMMTYMIQYDDSKGGDDDVENEGGHD